MMENKEVRPIQGVVIIAVPEGDGKTVCAAFAFQEADKHLQVQDTLQVEPPLVEPPVQPPVQAAQHPTPPPGGCSSLLKFGMKRTIILAFVLALVTFFWLRTPSLSYLEEQWDEGENRAHVHRLYAKYSVSLVQDDIGAGGDVVPPSELINRDSQRRNLRSSWHPQSLVGSANSSALFPLRGNVYPDGLYYLQLYVGNPPKPYYVDIDTGSDLTWLQCNAPCHSCPQTPHPLYDPHEGNLVDCKQPLCSELQTAGAEACSDASNQCDYEIHYGESSSTIGLLMEDTVYLYLTNGTLVRTKAVFGCSYDQRGAFALSPSKTDGLLGLSSSPVAFPSQFAIQGSVNNVVAHCLAGGNNQGGYLFFGDELVPSWGLTWTPMVKKNYYVSVQKLQYGTSMLDVPSDTLKQAEFLFDSGTSYTYFSSDIYNLFLNAVKSGIRGSGLEQDKSDKTLPLCWRGKTPFRSVSDASHYFQPITLDFGTSWLVSSRHFTVIPQAYLIVSSRGNVCLGILDANETGVSSANIIGDITLRGYLVVYDNVNNRVGWMQSDCRRPPKAREFKYV